MIANPIANPIGKERGVVTVGLPVNLQYKAFVPGIGAVDAGIEIVAKPGVSQMVTLRIGNEETCVNGPVLAKLLDAIFNGARRENKS